MVAGKPSIEAEQMTASRRRRPDGRVELHSFRFEVFDLPALSGVEEDLAHAGEVMAVAVCNAGGAFQALAAERLPDGLATSEQIIRLNADLAVMANRLENAVAALADAAWWIEHERRLTRDEAYDLITREGERRIGS